MIIESEILEKSVNKTCMNIISKLGDETIYKICLDLQKYDYNYYRDLERKAIKTQTTLNDIQKNIVFESLYTDLWKIIVNSDEKNIGDVILEE